MDEPYEPHDTVITPPVTASVTAPSITITPQEPTAITSVSVESVSNAYPSSITTSSKIGSTAAINIYAPIKDPTFTGTVTRSPSS